MILIIIIIIIIIIIMRERFKELDLGSRFISDQQMIIDNLYDD
jgi:hypothetical protein